jgi:hypothetical protein
LLDKKLTAKLEKAGIPFQDLKWDSCLFMKLSTQLSMTDRETRLQLVYDNLYFFLDLDNGYYFTQFNVMTIITKEKRGRTSKLRPYKPPNLTFQN